MEEVTIVGVDLAKRVFQLHGAATDGSVVFRRKLSRISWRGGRSASLPSRPDAVGLARRCPLHTTGARKSLLRADVAREASIAPDAAAAAGRTLARSVPQNP
jgi:hypothetical protein